MRHTTAAFLMCFAGLVPVVAHATPITYTLSTTASGELGGQSFTDALVTMTVYGDTADVTSGTDYIYNPAIGDADLSIAGLAPTTFSSSMNVLYAPDPGVTYYVGIENDVGPFLFAEYSNGFAGYDLASAFGPLTGGTNQNLGPDVNTPTAAGNFFLTSDPGDTTFTATVDSSVSPVPEPSGLCLLATGALIMLVISRRGLDAHSCRSNPQEPLANTL